MSDDRISINTTLDPVTHGVLAALAARESPGRAHANVTISRHVREELDRIAPGAWDELVEWAKCPPEGLTLRDVSQAVSDRVSAILRARRSAPT